ncbi:MAG: hypothetical protein HYT75_07145, partial [Deltaproteobacteria bacterium]|nr:hypothetical protein [Deltaproteobacteria bacterium]
MPETTFRWAPQTIVDQLLHKGFPEIIRELRDWVAIPSVSDPEKAAPGAPFGPEAGRMLDAFIRTAEKWGFTTTYKHPDGYYAYAEVGTGKQIIDIPGHGDVVDAGNPADWDNGDPWKLETKTLPDGTVVFVGRGV